MTLAFKNTAVILAYYLNLQSLNKNKNGDQLVCSELKGEKIKTELMMYGWVVT